MKNKLPPSNLNSKRLKKVLTQSNVKFLDNLFFRHGYCKVKIIYRIRKNQRLKEIIDEIIFKNSTSLKYFDTVNVKEILGIHIRHASLDDTPKCSCFPSFNKAFNTMMCGVNVASEC